MLSGHSNCMPLADNIVNRNYEEYIEHGRNNDSSM